MEYNATVILVIAIYMGIIILTGCIGRKGNKSATDFLVASRSLSSIPMVATMASYQIGVGTILSTTNEGYAYDFWPGIYYATGCGIGLMVLGFLSSRLREKKGFVPIDFFSDKYGESKGVRIWSWISNIPTLLGLFIAQIMACGSVLEIFGIPFAKGVFLCAVVILIYCYLGGMKGTAITNVVQMMIIMVGIPVLFLFVLSQYKASGFAVADMVCKPVVPAGMGKRFIYLFFPYLLTLSVNYDSYTRIQSAKDNRSAFIGSVGGGILVIIVGVLCSGTGAMFSRIHMNADGNVFIMAASDYLPAIGTGIMVSVVLSAAMSTANCVMLSLSSSMCRDFYNKVFHPEVDEIDKLPKARLISRMVIVVGIIVGAVGAMYVTNILDAIILFNYPFSASTFAPLFGALVWDKGTKKGAYASMAVGGVIGVVAFLSGIPSPIQRLVNTDLALLFAHVISSVVYIVVSLNDKDRMEKSRIR